MVLFFNLFRVIFGVGKGEVSVIIGFFSLRSVLDRFFGSGWRFIGVVERVVVSSFGLVDWGFLVVYFSLRNLRETV